MNNVENISSIFVGLFITFTSARIILGIIRGNKTDKIAKTTHSITKESMFDIYNPKYHGSKTFLFAIHFIFLLMGFWFLYFGMLSLLRK